MTQWDARKWYLVLFVTLSTLASLLVIIDEWRCTTFGQDERMRKKKVSWWAVLV